MIKRFVICIFFILATNAFAKSSDVQIVVEADFEPSSAIGLIISPKGSTQKLKTDLKTVTPGKYLVSFTPKETELGEDAYATAMLTSEEGEIAFGEVHPLIASSLHDPLFSLPKCKKQSAMNSTIQGQFALIESLSSVRAERRQVLESQVKNELKGEFLAKLQRMEEGFGIVHAEPISAELAPYDLLSRLQAISDAINDVKAQKQRLLAEQKAVQAKQDQAEKIELPTPTPDTEESGE